MAKPKKSLDNFTENEYSGARLLQRILSKETFGEKKKEIRKTFVKAASLPAIDIINGIAETTEVPREDRQQTLMQIYNAMVEAMEELEKVELPDVKWKDRAKNLRYADPCLWLIENYSSYGRGLTVQMVSAHDNSLAEAIRARRKKGLCPEGFELPTLDEVNSKKLEKYGGKAPTMGEISSASPPHVQDMIRLRAVARSRKYSNSNN